MNIINTFGMLVNYITINNYKEMVQYKLIINLYSI